MYLHTFGGSALLHLLAAYPRVVALFGLALTSSLVSGPQGPGRQIGTASHLERLDAATRPQAGVTEARLTAAELTVDRIIDRQERGEISAIVAETLRRCGSGCTDISTDRITSDAVLLRRVLVLHELDRAARTFREDQLAAPRAPRPPSDRTVAAAR